jgi:hypothetical protein
MALNFDSLFIPPVKYDSKIGIIYLYELRETDLDTWRKNHQSKPIDRIRLILPGIASFVEARSFTDPRPPLPSEKIEQISNMELDCIADLYTKTYFSKQHTTGNSQGSELNQHESLVTILDRKIRDRVQVRAHESLALFDKLRKSSNSLGNTIINYEHLAKADRLRHTGDRAQELEMVKITAEMTSKSAITLKNLADASVTLLEQMEQRDRKTDEFTKRQLSIAVWSVGISAALALVSLLFSIYISHQDNLSQNDEDRWRQLLLEAVQKDNKSSTRFQFGRKHD